jgi:hypothetical protein
LASDHETQLGVVAGNRRAGTNAGRNGEISANGRSGESQAVVTAPHVGSVTDERVSTAARAERAPGGTANIVLRERTSGGARAGGESLRGVQKQQSKQEQERSRYFSEAKVVVRSSSFHEYSLHRISIVLNIASKKTSECRRGDHRFIVN